MTASGKSSLSSEVLRSCVFGTGSGVRTGKGFSWRFGMRFSAGLAALKSCANWKIKGTCRYLGNNSEKSRIENLRGRTNTLMGEECERPPLPDPLLPRRRGRCCARAFRFDGPNERASTGGSSPRTLFSRGGEGDNVSRLLAISRHSIDEPSNGLCLAFQLQRFCGEL